MRLELANARQPRIAITYDGRGETVYLRDGEPARQECLTKRRCGSLFRGRPVGLWTPLSAVNREVTQTGGSAAWVCGEPPLPLRAGGGTR
jgi:hypothetical protein